MRFSLILNFLFFDNLFPTNSEKKFLWDLTKKLDMEAVRLSVWSYSGRPKLEFTFDEKYVRSALGRLKYRGGESMLGRALNVLDRFGWKRSRQARVQAFIFLFEISDMTLQPLKECETSSTCHNRRQLEGRFSSCCRDAQGQRSSAHICWLKQGQARYADA